MIRAEGGNGTCSICATAPGTGVLRMCERCRASYDRRLSRDDGTLASILEWAASRARRFAKVKFGNKQGTGRL